MKQLRDLGRHFLSERAMFLAGVQEVQAANPPSIATAANGRPGQCNGLLGTEQALPNQAQTPPPSTSQT